MAFKRDLKAAQMSPEELLGVGLDHLGRFAFFTRDNPFVSSTAALTLAGRHRRTLIDLLAGTTSADDWLQTSSARRLLGGIKVGCVPRDVQLVTRNDRQVIGVENVHAFLNAPLFWWMVSILWCLTVGREIEPMVNERIIGYRLHPGFLEDPENNGLMFREHTSSNRVWRRYPHTVARRYPGEVLATNTVDLKDFYYSVNSPPNRIVRSFLQSRNRPSPRSRQSRVLTRLLDELHRVYAQRCTQARPRLSLTAESVPLPVGLPSSRILANLVVSLVVDDLMDVDAVDAVAAYADDFIVMTRELPRMAEPPDTYLARLGILEAAEPPLLASPRAVELAGLTISIGKTATSYSRGVEPAETGGDETAEFAQTLEPADLDPYIEAEPDPDWGGRLRTVLRAPHRRDRVPRELSNEVKRLVDEVRVGLDAGETRQRLEAIIDEIDSSLFLALRPYWTELIVSGLAASGFTFVQDLTAHFVGLLDQLEPPLESTDEMATALEEGLRAAWIQATAQALAVALAEEELSGLESELPLLAQTASIGPLRTTSVVRYARRIRARRLIPGTLVSVPLAEFTSWKGRLIGPGAYTEFADWASELTGDQKVAQLSRVIGRSVRFVHLHEVCLALHLWMEPSADRGSWIDRAFRLLGRQPLIQQDRLAELRAKAEAALRPPGRDPDQALDDLEKPCLRFTLPSLRVEEGQLQALLDGDFAALGTIAAASRRQIRSLIGLAVKHKADFLVFPEWAVSLQQLSYVMERAAAHSMFTVAGESPGLIRGRYSNRVWTGIPVADSVGHSACLVPPPREKQHLSPHERKPLAANGVPISRSAGQIPTYTWRGVGLAALVCFEFADIATRTSLRPDADIVTVSSLNRDWRYFDAIQEATTRDNYCLTVCVNTGAYPGTRIMRPTKSEMAVAASVQGSDDPTVVTRVIDMHPIVAARRHGTAPNIATDREPQDDVRCLENYKPFPPL